MSLNDPNWGRGGGNRGPGGGNQGPPDLDELWRNFNRKLNDLFGRRRPPGGGAAVAPAVQRAHRRRRGHASSRVVLAVWLASGFYIVVEGQRGVVLTFGKFSEETGAGPALAHALADPVASRSSTSRRCARWRSATATTSRRKVLKESLMLTDDENIVDVQFAVQYTGEGRRGLPVQQPQARRHRAAGGRDRDARGRRQEQAWTSSCTRAASEVADRGAEADAGDPRPLQDRHPGQPGDHAERAAARAGAGGVRRRGQGRARTASARRTRARPTPTT